MKSFKRIACIAGAVAAATLFAGAADATLIIRDYAKAGDGLLTYDTRTGLEWLDFSVSVDRAPGSTLSTYTGFHMANLDEAEGLFISAGVAADHIKNGQQVLYREDQAAGILLVNTVGATYAGGTSRLITGRVLRSDGTHYDTLSAGIGLPGNASPGMWSKFLSVGNPLGSWQNAQADYLVRTAAVTDAVPEPAAWAMLIVGFGAVGGALRARGRRRVPAIS